MKIDKEIALLAKGDFAQSSDFSTIMNELHSAIQYVTWGSEDRFLINLVRKGNGVVPIKKNFVAYLQSNGWRAEQKMSCVNGINPGPIDVIKNIPQGVFAVEWETGNISSSHRALNKIAVGIIQKSLIGGILILPKRSLAQFLTDRIGNYEEINPYFTLYHHLDIQNGFIGVIAVDYDEIDPEVDIIPKGKDGNALK